MWDTYYGGLGVLHDTLELQRTSPGYAAGMERLVRKMARAVVWNETFVVGAMGSSVTAGHDNCNADSYERQLERILAPVVKALDWSFEVRNAGEGGGCGDSYENQIWCLRHTLGDDVDVTHYSWTYFEHEHKHAFHEMFIRWSLFMDKSPLPMILNTGNGDAHAAHMEDAIMDYKLSQAYAPWGFNTLYMTRGIEAYGYPGKEWGHVGDTLHNTTREGETADPVRRDSLGVVFRNWHPGPLLFQTTADTLALLYTTALRQALVEIHNCSNPKDTWPRVQPLLTAQDLPPVVACDEAWCGKARVPSCLNLEKPTYGTAQIHTMAHDDPFNPLAHLYDASLADWTFTMPPPSTLIPREERQRPECQHLDFCSGLLQRKGVATNPIFFRLPRMDLGFIAVCCKGKTCGQYLLDNNVTAWFDGRRMTPHKTLFGKCIEIQPSFEGPVEDTDGHLVLGLQVPPSSDDVIVSHVVTL